MDDLLADMVRARLGWVSPRLHDWYDDDRLARQLADGLRVEADRVGHETFGAEFRDAVGVDASPDPADWANRRLDLAPAGWAVIGIRFRGLDVSRPFVDVVATSEPPTPDGLAVVADAVGPAYAAFAPLALRVDAPDPAVLLQALAADPRFGKGSVDQYVVAGAVADLRAARRSASYNDISLRPGDPVELAGRVAAIYAELMRRNPALPTWATPQDAGSLRDCAAEGLLFEVRVAGEPAGVVASVRDDRHGLSGFGVEELCLDAGAVGRGLASGVVQRLVAELPAVDGDVLWGTIHPDNAPSLRNALSVGRQVVGGYVWVTPTRMPGMPRSS